MKQVLRLAVCIALVIGIGSCVTGCYLFPEEEETMAPPLVAATDVSYSTSTVEKGDIEEDIKGSVFFTYTDAKDLYFKGSGGRLDSISVRVDDKVKKGQVLARLQSDDLEKQVTVQKLAVESAKLAVEQAEDGGDKYSVKYAKIDLETAQVELAELEKQLKKTTLYSTIDGIVTYVNTDLSEGDSVEAYKTIISIADPDSVGLVYTGNSLGKLKVGMKATFTYGSATFKGKVVKTPSTDSNSSEDKKVIFSVEGGTPKSLKNGDSCSFKIVLKKKTNTIVISKSLLKTSGARQYVLLLVDGAKQEKDVETGLENSTQVEITDGLEEGDQIIIS